MKVKKILLSMAVLSLVLVASGCGQVTVTEPELGPGVKVLAKWSVDSDNWYTGQIDVACEKGWHVNYDDESDECHSKAELRMDVTPAAADISVGTQVFAHWVDTIYVPATVQAINNGQYDVIHNDDGWEDTVSLNELRVY